MVELVRPSMGSVADCYDDVMCESFFATLECELLDQKPLRTKTEARMAVFEFIERPLQGAFLKPRPMRVVADYIDN